jgi:hypothetical protein
MAALDLEKYNIRTDSLDIEQMLALCDELYDNNSSMQRLLYNRVNVYKNKLVEYVNVLYCTLINEE